MRRYYSAAAPVRISKSTRPGLSFRLIRVPLLTSGTTSFEVKVMFNGDRYSYAAVPLIPALQFADLDGSRSRTSAQTAGRRIDEASVCKIDRAGPDF